MRRQRRRSGYLSSFVVGFVFGGAIAANASVHSHVYSPWIVVGLPCTFGLAFLAAQWWRNAMLGY